MPAKRTRINSGRGGARFVRRDKQGQFNEVDAVGRSLKQDRARKAKGTAKSGQGDRGDRKVSAGRGTSRGRKASSTRTSRGGAKRGGGRKGR
jgi:hypothetical protein